MIHSLVVLAAWLASTAAGAHPLAPALLELKASANGQYAVQWRQSIARATGMELSPVLPATCHTTGEMQTGVEDGNAVVSRWQVDCGGNLAGQSLSIKGLEQSAINVILRIEDSQEQVVTTLLDADNTQFLVPAEQADAPVFTNYLVLGFEHLVLGVDHVLFVLGLLLLIRRLKPLVITITAFTMGHSITLALATLGLVQVNQSFTELGIALSILFLAHELVRPNPRSLFRRSPWLVACAFGLLHGLGFAGALAEVGLPQGEIPLALFAFNLGIECGQLLLVLVMLVLARLWGVVAQNRTPPQTTAATSLVALVPAYLIGALAAYWCIERTVSWLA